MDYVCIYKLKKISSLTQSDPSQHLPNPSLCIGLWVQFSQWPSSFQPNRGPSQVHAPWRPVQLTLPK